MNLGGIDKHESIERESTLSGFHNERIVFCDGIKGRVVKKQERAYPSIIAYSICEKRGPKTTLLSKNYPLSNPPIRW